MTLKVFGAGWGRTGTMSLKLALEQLGLGPCHHMGEVMGNPEQMEQWAKVANNAPFDWNEVFAGFHSACDWPSSHYWRELAEFYPESKVVLSVRPFEEWWNSYSKTIMLGMVAVEAGDENPMLRYLYDMSAPMFMKTFGGKFDDKDKFAAAHSAYEGLVRDYFADAPDRLLVFNVKQGWEPLCAFLDVPVPDGEFPRTNNTEEFQASQKP